MKVLIRHKKSWLIEKCPVKENFADDMWIINVLYLFAYDKVDVGKFRKLVEEVFG